MTLPGGTRPAPAASAEDRELLTASGLLDAAGYRVRAGLATDADAAAHYLEQGWLQGLEPRDDFEGEFLRPYYAASGCNGPPALVWLELSAVPGRPAPSTSAEALELADQIAQLPQ